MGYPIRTNLFRPGSQREFSRFAVQVLLLFRPDDRRFVDHLDAQFLDLHRRTGRDVVFFAPLDPPADWLSDSANRRWWTAYMQDFGHLGATFDDPVLVGELSRLFGIDLAELPVLLASPGFWAGDFVVCPTSAEMLTRQLVTLTGLARRVENPSIEELQRDLSVVGGMPAYPRRLAPNRKEQLGDFYETLSLFRSDRPFNEVEFDAAARRVVGDADRFLAERRPGRALRGSGSVDDEEERRVDACVEEAAGRLIPLATVAKKSLNRFPVERLPLALEEESSIMLETAYRVGWFLDLLARNGTEVDFTPGAQGAWKAFEREVNLSAIQAARGSLGIEMPEYFGLHKPSFSCHAPTGRGRPEDLNKEGKDVAGKRRHKFVSLGTAYYVIENLLQDPEGKLLLFLETELGFAGIEPTLREAWKRIYEIRNHGSHVEPLDRGRYDEVLGLVGQPAVMQPLLELKTKLRSRPTPND